MRRNTPPRVPSSVTAVSHWPRCGTDTFNSSAVAEETLASSPMVTNTPIARVSTAFLPHEHQSDTPGADDRVIQNIQEILLLVTLDLIVSTRKNA